VRVHVVDGRDADARWLDDDDGVDADAGQTWPGAAASFLGMWVVMMVAMMLPSLVPMLSRYREAVADQARRPQSADRTRGCGLLLRLDRVSEWLLFRWASHWRRSR